MCAGVYAMRGCMCRQVGAMRKCDVCRYDALCNAGCAGMVCYVGRAGRTECEYNAVYEIALKARDFDEKWQEEG